MQRTYMNSFFLTFLASLLSSEYLAKLSYLTSTETCLPPKKTTLLEGKEVDVIEWTPSMTAASPPPLTILFP